MEDNFIEFLNKSVFLLKSKRRRGGVYKVYGKFEPNKKGFWILKDSKTNIANFSIKGRHYETSRNKVKKKEVFKTLSEQKIWKIEKYYDGDYRVFKKDYFSDGAPSTVAEYFSGCPQGELKNWKLQNSKPITSIKALKSKQFIVNFDLFNSKFIKFITKYFSLINKSDINENTKQTLKSFQNYKRGFLILTKWIEDIESTKLLPTEKEALIKIRIGQSPFRNSLFDNYQNRCPITLITQNQLLVASHVKPWKDCNSLEEKLDSKNGILLSPLFDNLFDQGLITFDEKGQIIYSPIIQKIIWKIKEQIKNPNYAQEIIANVDNKYLTWHRKKVYKIK